MEFISYLWFIRNFYDPLYIYVPNHNMQSSESIPVDPDIIAIGCRLNIEWPLYDRDICYRIFYPTTMDSNI